MSHATSWSWVIKLSSLILPTLEWPRLIATGAGAQSNDKFYSSPKKQNDQGYGKIVLASMVLSIETENFEVYSKTKELILPRIGLSH